MKIRKLLLVFIFSIMFIPFVVNAETCENDKVSIESIEIKTISDNVVEKNEPIINGMGVKLDLEMSEVDDSIEYEMTIKNDSNTDYKLDKKSLNIESDYINYTFETKDKTNVVKAKSSSDAVLTVQYKNEVPEELLEDGSFTENKTINIGLNGGKNSITETVNNIITNPKTGQSLLFIMCLVLMVIVISLVVLKKNKKIGTLVLLLGLLSLPFSVYALCSINLKVESNVEINIPSVLFPGDLIIDQPPYECVGCYQPRSFTFTINGDVYETMEDVHWFTWLSNNNYPYGLRQNNNNGIETSDGEVLYNCAGEPVDYRAGIYYSDGSGCLKSHTFYFGDFIQQ